MSCLGTRQRGAAELNDWTMTQFPVVFLSSNGVLTDGNWHFA